MDDRWIVVTNWDKFQHYKERQPTWIKLYTELLEDEEWLRLSDRMRGILVCIWIEYALSRGQLGASPARLGLRFGSSTVRSRDLQRLSDAGFITIVASKPLALACARKRKSKNPLPPKRGGRAEGPKVTGWRLVRGSHGVTHIPDPAGVDRPPT